MSDEVKKPLSIFADADGDWSSGRVVKIFSFIVAVLFGTVGLVVMAFSGSVEFADYCLKITATFLGVATATEIVQKVTKL